MQQNRKSPGAEEGQVTELTDAELSAVLGGAGSQGSSGIGPIPGYGIPSFGSGLPGLGSMPGLPSAAGQSAAAPGSDVPSLSSLLGMIAN